MKRESLKASITDSVRNLTKKWLIPSQPSLNVKGTDRRKMIRDYWNAGKLEELDEQHLLGSLDNEQRRNLGRLHPSFMGGEYLPNPLANETEIARIELESTTSDVISIQATSESSGFRFRIVDEYETECCPAQSQNWWSKVSVGSKLERL